MENLLKDMGKRIFDRRKQLNMTQETLAELAHVTPQTISTAELGQKAMRPETVSYTHLDVYKRQILQRSTCYSDSP